MMKQNKRKTRTTRLFRAIKNSLRKRGTFIADKNAFMNCYPRHIARSVAKANMKRAGAVHVNRIFSYYWRDFVITR